MNRRDFLVSGGAVSIAASLPMSAQAESNFSYSSPITMADPLPIPGGRKVKVAFAINPGVQVIDLAGPWEVFQDTSVKDGQFNMPGGEAFELYTVSENTEPLRASGGLRIVPNYSIHDAPVPDLLIIPHFATRGVTPIHDWIKQTHEAAGQTVSICTGAIQLAKTGLLDGKPATTNQSFYDLFEKMFPKVMLKRGPRFVEAGDVTTAGGLSAGIDVALRVVDRYFGRDVAQATADEMEYAGTGWHV